MRTFKIFIGILFLAPFFFGCNNKLDVNADWKEITVVYALLNQNDTIHYFRITKAFLGNGNALVYAQIPDSSYYHDSLDIKMEEYKNSSLQKTFSDFKTTIDTTKPAGVFYYPYQLLFYTTGALDQDADYKLIIKNKSSGKGVTSQTSLIRKFDITKPQMFDRANFQSGKNSQVQWTSAVGGKRYQLLIRFHYLETLLSDTSQHSDKYVDWVAFKDVLAPDADGGRGMDYLISGDAFYIVVGSHVPESDLYHRLPRDVEYIFSVAGEDMNTYMEVTEPSTGLIQERPTFTNIINGVGLFSCIYDNRKDTPLVLQLSDNTLDELKTNEHTINRGF